MFARRLLVLSTVVAAIAATSTAYAGGSITITSVDPSTGHVAGTVVYPQPEGPEDVQGFRAHGPLTEDAGEVSGLDLVRATIEPLADGSGLRFAWVVSELPAQVPPEGVRYTWAFAIGDNQYQLQAKRTNVASVTTAEDPLGHARHLTSLQDFFQLRGACEEEYMGAPVSGCYHLAFLDGSFDTDTGTITVDVPFRTRDSIGRIVAEDFVPGVILEPLETAGMSIAASYQAVVSNSLVSVYINDWDPYFVGGGVHAGVGPKDLDPRFIHYGTQATVDGSSFEAIVGPIGETEQIYVRACNGVTCVYAAA